MISWPNFRSRIPFLARSGKRPDHAHYVPRRRIRVPAQQEIRARQVKEMKGVGLDELSHVLQLA